MPFLPGLSQTSHLRICHPSPSLHNDNEQNNHPVFVFATVRSARQVDLSWVMKVTNEDRKGVKQQGRIRDHSRSQVAKKHQKANGG